MPMTCSPASPYWRCQREKTGISSIQGPHQVAQKFSSTIRPLNWSSRSGRPNRSVRVKSGAMVFSRPAGSAAASAAKIRIDRQAHNAAMPSRRGRRGTILPAFGDGVAFFDPFSAEVMGDIQSFDIAKAERPQRREGGADIWAFAPRAATAVDDDRGVFGKLSDALSQHGQAGAIVTWACIFGGDDMGFVKEFAEANLKDERLRPRV